MHMHSMIFIMIRRFETTLRYNLRYNARMWCPRGTLLWQCVWLRDYELYVALCSTPEIYLFVTAIGLSMVQYDRWTSRSKNWVLIAVPLRRVQYA